MSTFEEQPLKNYTIRNLIITVVSTATIVSSVVLTYSQLKDDIRDVKSQQETQNRVTDLRLKLLEDHVNVLQQQIDELKKDKQ
jgi:trans-aconitate methyltransferase